MNPPRGRPRIQETADEIVASVLATAGPRVSSAQYSTRRVAELTGLTQSVVSRAFRRIREGQVEVTGAGGAVVADVGGAGGGAAPVLPGEEALKLVGLSVSFPEIRLTFQPADHPPGAQQVKGTQHMKNARPARTPHAGSVAFHRRASAVMAALWVSGAGGWPGAGAARSGSPAAHPASGDAASGGAASAVGEMANGSLAGPELVWRPGVGSWGDFLSRVASMLDRCASSPEPIPGDLLHQLAARVGRGLHGVHWRRDSPGWNRRVSDSELLAVPEYPTPGRATRWLPHTELSVTEQIAIALRKEIMNAGYRPGDRITADPVAARLGLGTATIRTAMRRLADDGLLDATASGFRVPQVTGADVVDLYAARLHVGMVLLRGCAVQPRNRLLPARLALGAVEAAARRGVGPDVDQADLQFQQELADAAGLQQSARSFHALTLRVRMFISVLQLDYTPAVDRIVQDDRRLVAALLAGRAEEAVRTWRGKLDNAVRHMSALAPEAFDAELWARLSRT